MSLQQLIDGIEREVLEEVARIIASADEESGRIREAAAAEAEGAARRETEAAIAHCRSDAAQRLSQARLAARNRLLEVEQALIDDAFDEAMERLRSMDDGAYRAWLTRRVLATLQSPEEYLVMQAADRARLGPSWQGEVEAALREQHGPENLKIEFTEDDLGGGFIVRHPRYDIDVTFRKILESLRNERLTEVARILFET